MWILILLLISTVRNILPLLNGSKNKFVIRRNNKDLSIVLR